MKITLKTETANNNTPEYLINTILSSKNINKILYNKEIESMRLTQMKHTTKWETELEKSEIEWKQIFTIPNKCTISTKLRAFQYKYLMRIIPNNSYLLKCKLKPFNLCDCCHMSIDTNKHMFWECNIIQTFWSEINQMLQSNRLDYNSTLSYETISFCNKTGTSTENMIAINFIILIAKYYVFKSRCNSVVTIF